MIQANVHSTQTMVNQRAIEIRMRELELFTANLGVVASLAAFFAETSLESLYIEPETVAKDDPRNHFSTACWTLSAVTISLNLMTLLVSIFTMLHGPAMAIRGPAGSMPLAVSRIFVQRKLALKLFWAGLLSKVVQAAALAAWRYPPQIAAAVAAVFICFMFATAQCIVRVTRKFSFKQFGLRREEFIEIGLSPNNNGTSSNGNSSSYTPPTGNVHGSPSTHPSNQVPGQVMSGWLMKRSSYLKRWNSRFFVLTTQGELMWSTSTAAPARGTMILYNGDVDVAQLNVTNPGVPHFGLTISQRHNNHVTEVTISTDSAQERVLWTQAILNATGSHSTPSDDPSTNPFIPAQNASLK